MAKLFCQRSDGDIKNESTGYVTDNKMIFTPDAGNHILFFKNTIGEFESVSQAVIARWRYDQGTPTTINDFAEPVDTTPSEFDNCAIKQINFSNASTTLYSEFQSLTSSFIKSRFGRLWAWNPTHQYAESEGTSTTTSTSMQDKLELAFTPGATDDYLIIWSAQVYNSSTAYATNFELTVEGTVRASGRIDPDAGTVWYAVGGFYIANLASGASRSIKIRYTTINAGGTAGIKCARIVAIPLSGYTYHTDQETTTETTASTTFVDSNGSVGFTPSTDGYYLMLGSIECGYDGGVALNIGGTDRDKVEGFYGDDSTSSAPMLLCDIRKLTATSQTLKIRKRSMSTATITFGNARVVAIRVNSDIQQLTHIAKGMVSLGTDDGMENETDAVFTTSNADVEAGIGGAGFSDVSNIGLRFQGLDLVNAATIDEAYLNALFDAALTGTPLLKILGLDEDNTATFSTLSDYTGRTRTTAAVDWDPTSGSIDTYVKSAEIKTVIQEIVDRAGFAAGNALGIVIDDDGSTGTEYIRIEDFDSDPNEMSHIFIRWNEVIQVGVNYTKELTDVLVLVDTIIKQPGKVVSEAVALVDTLLKQAGRTLSEAVVLVDTVLKQGMKVLTEAVVLVDTLIKGPGKLATETVVLSDTFSRQWTLTRTLSEAVVLVDTVLKQNARSFAEAIPLADTVLKMPGKVLSDAIVLADTTVKQASRTLSDVIVLVDSLIKQPGKTLSEAIILVDTFIGKITARILTESITLVDTVTKQTQRLFTEALVLADTVLKQAQKVLSEALTLVDDLRILRSLNLTEAVVLVDTVLKQASRTLGETLILADTLLKQGKKVLSESVILADTFLRTIGKVLNETVTLVDTIVKQITRTFSEAIILVDTVLKQSSRTFTEALALIDTVLKQAGKFLTDTLVLADTIVKQPGKLASEVIVLVDSFVSRATLFRTFTEFVNILDHNPVALSFNGSTQYYEISGFDLTDILTEFTIEFDYKPTAHELNDRVVDLGDSGPLNGFTFVQGSSAFNCIIRNGSTITGTKSFGSLANDTWHHIIATLKSGTLKGYLNGAAQGSDVTGVVMGDTSTVLTVGKRSAGSNYFNGRVKDLRIYTREISSSEASEHYQGRYANELGLYLWHEHDEGSGSVIKDRSGNGRDGSNVNVAWVNDMRTLTYSGGVFFSIARTLSEIVTLVDARVSFLTNKVLSEALVLADTVVKQSSRVFQEVVVLADTIIKSSVRVFTEAVALQDSVVKQIGRSMGESVILADTLTRGAFRAFTESVVLVDNIVKQGQKVLSEAVTIVDSVYKTINRVFSEVLGLADTLLKQVSKTLSEVIVLVDTVIFPIAYTIIKNETIVLVDTIVNVFTGAVRKGISVLLTALDGGISVLKSGISVLHTTKRDRNVLQSKGQDTHALGTKKRDKSIL